MNCELLKLKSKFNTNFWIFLQFQVHVTEFNENQHQQVPGEENSVYDITLTEIWMMTLIFLLYAI